MTVLSHTLGFPRIGAQRELKKACESYWKGEITQNDLQKVGKQLRKRHWLQQKKSGLDHIPANDFSYYDQMLDMTQILGLLPERFLIDKTQPCDAIDHMFTAARGVAPTQSDNLTSGPACEMTKWFDTNYHYIVPELSPESEPQLQSEKILNEVQEAKNLDIPIRPVIIGPLTFLSLSRSCSEAPHSWDPLQLINRLLPVYEELFEQLQTHSIEWLQVDEPILGCDLTEEQKNVFTTSWNHLLSCKKRPKILCATYFSDPTQNANLWGAQVFDSFHIDCTRLTTRPHEFIKKLNQKTILSLGMIDGRNIWKNDYENSIDLIKLFQQNHSENIWIGTSCSLLHSPHSLQQEQTLQDALRLWFAFADEKLEELSDLKQILSGHASTRLQDNQAIIKNRKTSAHIHNKTIQHRVATLTQQMRQRTSDFKQRKKTQQQHCQLPDFPTTTIGSFPQTAEVRKKRRQFRDQVITQKEYDQYLKEEIKQTIQIQENIGLDVLVHGEFERNDMVESFGELLEGFCFTEHGWVQSYGSRCVKPPILYGDISRTQPMTVQWSQYAQSLTEKPVKGMLTGPVTILKWSFLRDDIKPSIVADQLALALRDEITDLVDAGLHVIQVDEPALREGFPLLKKDMAEYLKWATEAFRLATSGCPDHIQIHTHMCYADFHDIMDAIASLDADVISLEASRSQMELLASFPETSYPNDIGPGVYDIHSPRIPSTQEIKQHIESMCKMIPKTQLWINPDCGLKTRSWDEVKPSLEHMVEAAKTFRQQSIS